ncbi:MAG: DUF5036 family protein [Mediterranea sp.]|jgi:hypothetical protein|nr:DUF5036 family protein [Mediterranea sp.]
MRRYRLAIFTLLAISTSCWISCDKEDDTADPPEAITLNMMNELNGKTFLESSALYINKANNFTSNSSVCAIKDAGEAFGIGAKKELDVNQLAPEVAVVPGHFYQVFTRDDVYEFPSKQSAIKVGSICYQVYVSSNLSEGRTNIGAKVKYLIKTPNDNSLPPWGKTIGQLSWTDKWLLQMKVPSNCEYAVLRYPPGMSSSSIEVSIRENDMLTIELKRDISAIGVCEIYLRSGAVFTSVNIEKY